MAKLCSSCGRSLGDLAPFCDGCGAAQPTTQIPVMVPRSARPPSSPRPNSVILVVAVLLVGLVVGFAIGAVAFSGQIMATRIQSPPRPDLVQYCFSPGGNCASIIISWITRANSSIHIMIYSFTLNNVGDALVAANQRGVDVKVVWDESNWNATGSEYQKLKNAGIDIRVDHRHGLLHDKVAIIDNHIIITGSFNWSQAANEENRENLLILNSSDWAAAYEQQFQNIYNASTA